MIVESLVGLSLVLNVSLESRTALTAAAPVIPELSIRQKEAALLPLVNRATDCIVRQVFADPRYRHVRPAEINDLIIDSIPACEKPVRAMIEAHDRLYGSGSGEAFLLGPYLDVLPSAIVRQAGVKTP
ncbi:MAG: hypothetical protein JSR72_13155 [Proteobacteria bacterium]|nr:hypothetical protein [Pseudomonadota bacterium]